MHARRLAPAHCHLSPPESEDERASPKRNRNSKVPPKKPKKQLKSPTKNVKDVNDNTKVKEVVANALSSPKTVKKQQNKKNNKKDDAKQDTQKRERKDSKTNCQKKDEGSKPKQPKIEVSTDVKTEEKSNTCTDPVCTELKNEIKSNSWTRDEDKTMLEVLKGEADTEQVFMRIRELLPHRSVTEIKERFCHVMTLLQQMAVGEVT